MIINLQKRILKIGSDLYEIKRILKESDKFDIEALKCLYNVPVVFRRDGNLYFVDKIQDLDIEELTQNLIQDDKIDTA